MKRVDEERKLEKENAASTDALKNMKFTLNRMVGDIDLVKK